MSSKPLQSSDRAERRQLTVLFSDMVGSTQLAENLDPEDLRRLIGGYRELCRAAIERYGGYVAQFAGDGVLAYFGYPQGHENNAERAVRAGLEIVRGRDRLNIGASADRVVRMRIGITTGLVVVGPDLAAIGPAPNLAERLQKLATENTIVIGPETRRLALDHFEYRDLGEQPLDGVGEPVRVWQVLGERATSARFEARPGFGTTPFVGRAEELALIQGRWERVENGEGQVVLLPGEPGIGKSRLAQVVRDQLPSPHTFLRYQCSPYHVHSALFPVIEQIKRAAEFDASDAPGARIGKIKSWLRAAFSDKEVSEAAPLFASLLSIDAEGHLPLEPAALKDATLKWLASYLFALAGKRPVLLIVEDAQWIDGTTQEALGVMLRGISRRRVLTLITYRPQYQPPWSGLSHALTLPLLHLPRRQSELMIAEVRGAKPLPRELIEQIVAKSDGVPLFIEELTKTILESGQIAGTADARRASSTLPELAIPAEVRDSLMARLDRAAPMREVAQVGSCIGRQFSREVLTSLTALDEAALSDALRQLEDAGLVFGGGAPGSMSYTFKHALVRDVAYHSLLKSERKVIHARIAGELRESGDIVASAPETLAYHYMEAENLEQAAAYWCKAAKRAEARYANAELIAHCENGLEALKGVPPGAEHTGMELELRIGLAAGLRITDRHVEALAELVTAEALAKESGRMLELSRVHHLRGNIYYPLPGKIESCYDEHQAALKCAKAARSVEDQARALGGLGDGHFLAGRIQEAHKQFEDCVKLARDHRSRLTEVAYLPMRAVTHMYCLRYGESLDDCRAVIGLVAEVGRARGELISRNTSSWVLLDQRKLQEAEEDAQKGLEAVKEIGARRFMPLFNDALARVRLHAGDRAGALKLLDAGWEVSQQTGVAFVGPVVLGAIALATSDAARRVDALRRGVAILKDGCASHNFFRFYRDAIEVSLEEGAWKLAEDYATALQSSFPEPAPWARFFIARGRALAAAGREASREKLAQLRTLRQQAIDFGLLSAVARLDQALKGA